MQNAVNNLMTTVLADTDAWNNQDVVVSIDVISAQSEPSGKQFQNLLQIADDTLPYANDLKHKRNGDNDLVDKDGNVLPDKSGLATKIVSEVVDQHKLVKRVLVANSEVDMTLEQQKKWDADSNVQYENLYESAWVRNKDNNVVQENYNTKIFDDKTTAEVQTEIKNDIMQKRDNTPLRTSATDYLYNQSFKVVQGTNNSNDIKLADMDSNDFDVIIERDVVNTSSDDDQYLYLSQWQIKHVYVRVKKVNTDGTNFSQHIDLQETYRMRPYHAAYEALPEKQLLSSSEASGLLSADFKLMYLQGSTNMSNPSLWRNAYEDVTDDDLKVWYDIELYNRTFTEPTSCAIAPVVQFNQYNDIISTPNHYEYVRVTTVAHTGADEVSKQVIADANDSDRPLMMVPTPEPGKTQEQADAAYLANDAVWAATALLPVNQRSLGPWTPDQLWAMPFDSTLRSNIDVIVKARVTRETAVSKTNMRNNDDWDEICYERQQST
jgi:hypothetical protein